jgi:hypothetical protein
VRKIEGKRQLESVAICRCRILKLLIKIQDVKVWIGFVKPRIGTSGRFLGTWL